MENKPKLSDLRKDNLLKQDATPVAGSAQNKCIAEAQVVKNYNLPNLPEVKYSADILQFLSNPTIELYDKMGAYSIFMAAVKIGKKEVFLAIASILKNLPIDKSIEALPTAFEKLYNDTNECIEWVADFRIAAGRAARIAEDEAQEEQSAYLQRVYCANCAACEALDFAKNKLDIVADWFFGRADEARAASFNGWNDHKKYLKFFAVVKKHLPFSLFVK